MLGPALKGGPWAHQGAWHHPVRKEGKGDQASKLTVPEQRPQARRGGPSAQSLIGPNTCLSST